MPTRTNKVLTGNDDSLLFALYAYKGQEASIEEIRKVEEILGSRLEPLRRSSYLRRIERLGELGYLELSSRERIQKPIGANESLRRMRSLQRRVGRLTSFYVLTPKGKKYILGKLSRIKKLIYNGDWPV